MELLKCFVLFWVLALWSMIRFYMPNVLLLPQKKMFRGHRTTSALRWWQSKNTHKKWQSSDLKTRLSREAPAQRHSHASPQAAGTPAATMSNDIQCNSQMHSTKTSKGLFQLLRLSFSAVGESYQGNLPSQNSQLFCYGLLQAHTQIMFWLSHYWLGP